MATTTTTNLPPPRLITTSHNPSGQSTLSVSHPPAFQPFGPTRTTFHHIYTSSTVPIPRSNLLAAPPTNEPTSESQAIPYAPPAGVTGTIMDIPVGKGAPMHKTRSLDYCIVLSGEVVLVVEEGGREEVIKQGEAVVQRGTVHAWENRGKEVARMFVVVVGSAEVPVEVEKGDGPH
ncbi:MAG: hypothetical protein M1819_006282 [Sarea resinae]|nr:MAG: hypothetical protein M1819_006282 [Sarea resinae]